MPPTAVQLPAQLTPRPQVTKVALAPRQQATSMVSLLKVKLLSNSARVLESPLVVWFSVADIEGCRKSAIYTPLTRTGLAMARLGLIGFSLALEAAEGRGNAVPPLGLVPFSTSLAAGAPLPPVAPLPVNWGLRGYFHLILKM